MQFIKDLYQLKLLTKTIASGIDTPLTNAELNVLFLTKEYVNIAPSILVSKLDIKKSNITTITKQLISEGYLTLTRSETDRRQIFFSITEKGEKVLDDNYRKIKSNYNITATPELMNKINDLIEYLNRKI